MSPKARIVRAFFYAQEQVPHTLPHKCPTHCPT